MDPVLYNAFVRRLEQGAAANAPALRRQMYLMLGLGYGYVLLILGLVVVGMTAMLAMLVSGTAPALAFKLLLPLGALGWLIVKSIWVKTQPPEGEVLDISVAPELTRRVEEIRRELRAPRVDTMLLTGEFNASVTQVPRLGIFGWPRTYLTLGVPLMFALDRARFDAVLAHEFAHLSGSHPKRGLWVYRMSRTWQQLLVHLHETRTWARKLFEGFVSWYVPRLEGYGFVLSRQDEYAADADAARVTSPAAIGGALVTLATQSASIATLWEQIWSRVETEPVPPAKSWSTLPLQLQQGLPRPQRQFLLERALTHRTDANDTHPSLAERLRALGLPNPDPENVSIASDPPVAGTSAADHYLGAVGHQLLHRLETDWHERVGDVWRQRHAQTKAERSQMNELLDRDEPSMLTDEELWTLAVLVARFRSDRDAEPYYTRLLTRAPHHTGAQFALGRLLLGAGHADGVLYLERVMAQEPDAVAAACELLYQFYAQRGDEDGLARIRQRLYEHQQLTATVLAERENVGRQDQLVDADLAPEDFSVLRTIAQADSRVQRLWVARKVTAHRPERPLLILLIERRLWRMGSWGRDDRQLAQDIGELVDLSRPSDYLVIVVGSATAWLLKRVSRLPKSRVFAR
jgi:Zn-dependent protease with chaperone function